MLLLLTAVVLSAMLWIWPLTVGFVIGRIDHDATDGWRAPVSDASVWLLDHIGLVILVGIAGLVLVVWVFIVEVGGANHWPDRAPQITALGVAGAIVFTYGTFFRPSVWVGSVRVEPDGSWVWPYRRELELAPGVNNDVFIGIHNVGITAWNRYRVTVEFPRGCVASTPDPNRKLEWAPGRVSVQGARAQVERDGPIAVAEPQVLRLEVNAPRASLANHNVIVRVACAGHVGEAVCKLRIRERTHPTDFSTA